MRESVRGRFGCREEQQKKCSHQCLDGGVWLVLVCTKRPGFGGWATSKEGDRQVLLGSALWVMSTYCRIVPLACLVLRQCCDKSIASP